METETKPNKTSYWFLLVVMLIVTAIWLLTPTIISYFAIAETNAGPYGDMFGSINALFSGLAFSGIIFSIRLQSEEMALARHEFQHQSKTFARQSFEATFFNLLNTQRNTLESVSVNYKDVDEKGVKALKHLTDRGQVTAFLFEKSPEVIPFQYLKVISETNAYLNQYLLTMVNLLNYIEQRITKPEEQEEYYQMVACVMSLDEINFIKMHAHLIDQGNSSRMLHRIYEMYDRAAQNKDSRKITL